MILTKPRPVDTMTPKEIMEIFSNALESFELINGQPSDSNLTQIWEVLATLLLQIPYDKTEEPTT